MRNIEPWGVLLAVIGLVVTLIAFWIDYSDRIEERTVRAWQLLTEEASGNSGKSAALQYLNGEDGLCLAGWCLYVMKPRIPLTGIDLSPPGQAQRAIGHEPSGVYLRGVKLPGADLSQANLSGADLARANLAGSNLRQANLSGARLGRANLSGSKLNGANLSRVILWATDLSNAKLGPAMVIPQEQNSDFGLTPERLDTDLSKAAFFRVNLSGADLSFTNLSGLNLSNSNLSAANLASACGDERTRLPVGMAPLRPCPAIRRLRRP